MRFLIAQIIGLIAMGICVSSFLCKDSRRLLVLQIVGNSLFILQFVLLDAYSGVLGVVVLVVSNMIQVQRMQGTQWANTRLCHAGILAAALASSLTTWVDWFSILPCIANIAFIQSNRTGDTRIIRIWKILAVGPCWAIYSLHTQSYFSVASELTGMCVAATALICAHCGVRMPQHTKK